MKTIISVAIAAFGIIIAALLLSNAFKNKTKSVQNISVTGSSEKDFVSDQIVWSGSFSRKTMELRTAYQELKADEATIANYLRGKGVTDSEMVFSAVRINKDYTSNYDENGRSTGSVFNGYDLSQYVTVDSRDINKVEKISREVTELIQSGIEFNSSEPSYYYTKLSELKIDLLAKAAADAKLRAETIAKNSGSSLGGLRKSSMGVFQITGQNSNEDYSYGGVFNTTSKNKTATITVRSEFAAR